MPKITILSAPLEADNLLASIPIPWVGSSNEYFFFHKLIFILAHINLLNYNLIIKKNIFI